MSEAVPFVLPEALEGRVLFAAAPIVYEAEAASLSGATVARNHAGFTGAGFVDYRARSGESVEWTVRAEEAGTYLLSFRFANGGDANRPLALGVNGRSLADEAAFMPTGSWTKWNTVARRVTLSAGVNRVRLTSVRRSGPNLDSLTLSPEGVAVPPTGPSLQAEAGSLSGVKVYSYNHGYTGAGYIDFEHDSGDYVQWSMNAPSAGVYELNFRYANGAGSDRPLRLSVDGDVVRSAVAFGSTGEWTAWRESKVVVSLAAGTHDVRLTATGSGGPNLDALTVLPAPAQDVRSLRVFHIGNSVTNTIQYRNLVEMAAGDGREYVWGRHMIPGAPLSYIWTHPTSGFETDYGFYREALREHQWDVLTLQPFDRQIESSDGQGDLTMAKNFINLALQKSPDLQVYIYQRWPRRSGKPGDYSLDYEAQWLRQYNPGKWDKSMETRDYFARLTEALRDAYPQSDKPVLMVPVGDVMFELAHRIEDGDVPGLDSIEDLYYDGIHLNNIGSLVTATTFYATMYNRDPRGIDHTAYNVIDDSYDRVVSTRTAAAIQDAVWDVVKGHQYSGVS